jgi:hypothetical protein
MLNALCVDCRHAKADTDPLMELLRYSGFKLDVCLGTACCIRSRCVTVTISHHSNKKFAGRMRRCLLQMYYHCTICTQRLEYRVL